MHENQENWERTNQKSNFVSAQLSEREKEGGEEREREGGRGKSRRRERGREGEREGEREREQKKS